MRIDVIARRWGGPEGGPDGMAVASSYLAFTLCELGHQVRGYIGAGEPPWKHARMDWRSGTGSADWTADLIVTTNTPTWQRTAAAAELAGARGRLVYWHHYSGPPEGLGCIFAAPPSVTPSEGWARTLVLPPSSWAAEAGGACTGVEVLVPGSGRAKGGLVAVEVARLCPELRFYVLKGRGGAADLAPWRELPNVAIAEVPVSPASFLARAGVVLLPTKAEVHPLVLVEAAARGIPIVCTDLSATRAAAPGATFLPVESSHETWATALRGAVERQMLPLRLPPYASVVMKALDLQGAA